MALTDLMMEYVRLTNKLKKEDRELQRKQLLYQLDSIQQQINNVVKARGEVE